MIMGGIKMGTLLQMSFRAREKFMFYLILFLSHEKSVTVIRM